MSKSIYDEEYRKLIDDLRSERKAAGLTQQALADRLTKPQSFVAKVEGYERRLDVIEFLHWCRVLDVDAAEFLKNLGDI
ncbi:MAG: helix-turn-helix domain-containing protein [Pelagimonas sp.]|uniref:helix-turn-helix domain-containing protein n=1 Tax=Pelagimonas sp. TaxID=2073170 RepID=UPI003D6B53F0